MQGHWITEHFTGANTKRQQDSDRKSFNNTFFFFCHRHREDLRLGDANYNTLNLTIKGYFLRLNIRQKCPSIVWLSVLRAQEEFQHLGSVDSSCLLSWMHRDAVARGVCHDITTECRPCARCCSLMSDCRHQVSVSPIPILSRGAHYVFVSIATTTSSTMLP